MVQAICRRNDEGYGQVENEPLELHVRCAHPYVSKCQMMKKSLSVLLNIIEPGYRVV